jgi:hypothetical protein
VGILNIISFALYLIWLIIEDEEKAPKASGFLKRSWCFKLSDTFVFLGTKIYRENYEEISYFSAC